MRCTRWFPGGCTHPKHPSVSTGCAGKRKRFRSRFSQPELKLPFEGQVLLAIRRAKSRASVSTGTPGHSAENGVLTFAGIDPIAYILPQPLEVRCLASLNPEILYNAGTELIVENLRPLITEQTLRATSSPSKGATCSIAASSRFPRSIFCLSQQPSLSTKTLLRVASYRPGQIRLVGGSTVTVNSWNIFPANSPTSDSKVDTNSTH